MPLIHLRILLPNRVLLDVDHVSSVVAETSSGSFGLLPNREDCVATLKPGILAYGTADGHDEYVAVDQGTLIKFKETVLVSVRRALLGNDLARLRDAVIKQFVDVTEHEKSVRAVMKKLETGFMRRVGDMSNG